MRTTEKTLLNFHRNAQGDPAKIKAFMEMTSVEYETYLLNCDLAAQIAEEIK